MLVPQNEPQSPFFRLQFCADSTILHGYIHNRRGRDADKSLNKLECNAATKELPTQSLLTNLFLSFQLYHSLHQWMEFAHLSWQKIC